MLLSKTAEKDMNLWLIIAIAVVKLKPEKKLWVHNIPVEGEGCKWIYERSYIWTAEKDMNYFMIDHCSYTHNLSSCEIKAWTTALVVCVTAMINHKFTLVNKLKYSYFKNRHGETIFY